MATKELHLAQLIWQIRRLSQRLATESHDLLSSYGINPSHRLILQSLDNNQTSTLADMARVHSVSRQHVQQVVNDLLAKKLVETVDNPGHRRSFLVRRTAKGDALFGRIKRMESSLFREIARQFDEDALQTSVVTLTKISRYFFSPEWESAKKQIISNEKESRVL